MTLVIPNGWYEASMEHHLTGSLRPAIVTLGVGYLGGTLEDDAQELADSWAVTLVQSMADVWAYTNFKLRDADGVVYERSEATAGGTAHTATTPNVSFLFHKQTGSGGRAQRGRWYLPGVSEQDVDAVGVVAGSKLTELAANLTNYLAALSSNSWAPFILHTNPALAPSAITQFTVANLAATQRRRMRK